MTDREAYDWYRAHCNKPMTPKEAVKSCYLWPQIAMVKYFHNYPKPLKDWFTREYINGDRVTRVEVKRDGVYFYNKEGLSAEWELRDFNQTNRCQMKPGTTIYVKDVL